MNTPIQDRFTHLQISRQRKWQLGKQAAGLCTECGKPAVSRSSLCLKHLVAVRERERKTTSRVLRYKGSLSYRLENAGLISNFKL
jgi:hypothetical protein